MTKCIGYLSNGSSPQDVALFVQWTPDGEAELDMAETIIMAELGFKVRFDDSSAEAIRAYAVENDRAVAELSVLEDVDLYYECGQPLSI